MKRRNAHRAADHRTQRKGRPSILDKWFKKSRLIAGLQSEADINATVVRIRSGVQLRGANLWILLCAAIIASIGLNTSSAAVIIGAMLISPLMGPILGIGLGIAIHDRAMLVRALRTFGAAVVVSLLTSSIYFWITPITFPTPELLARTSPTLLDVGIAFFGGIAGIIAGSRRETTTAIPGVAIATALMPPLCTAGYGLANANWTFFWGAIYLFSLNTVFISLATFLIVRLLDVPFVTYVDPVVERRVVRWIFVIVMAAIIPSVVLFYNAIDDLRHRNDAERFVRKQLEVEGRKAMSWSLESTDTDRVLKVYLAGTPMPLKQVDSLSMTLTAFGLDNSRLKVVQLNLPPQTETHVDPQELLIALKSAELQEELARSMKISSVPEETAVDTLPIASIKQEMLMAFPRFNDISYAEQISGTSDSSTRIHVFLVHQAKSSLKARQHDELARMQRVLSLRLRPDSVRVIEIADSIQVDARSGLQQ